MSKGQAASGWFTGFSELDSATGGLRPGETWVLGAPTNWGKTAFCLAVADHFMLVHGKGVLFVTCEDPPDLIGARLLCRRAEVNGKNARLGRLSVEEYDRCTQVMQGASTSNEVPIMLDGRGVHIEAICSDIQDIVAKHGPMLVIADYLQKMRTERRTDNRRHEVNHISQTLSNTTQRLNCPLLLTSQITGEQEALRESQDTENEASVVIVGRRGEDDSVSLLLRKNKAAPDRMFEMQMNWNRTTGCFDNRTSEYG
jgi:replicative DNA helicase